MHAFKSPQNLNCSFGRTKSEGEYKRQFLNSADTILCVDCLDISNNIGAYEGARGAGEAVEKKEQTVIDLSLNDFSIEHWTHLGGPLQPVDIQVQADNLYGVQQLLSELRKRAQENPDWAKRSSERRKEIAKIHETLRSDQKRSHDGTMG